MDYFLEGVGVHFVDFTIEKGYGEMLHTLGRNFHAFLDNLDYLHWYVNPPGKYNHKLFMSELVRST